MKPTPEPEYVTCPVCGNLDCCSREQFALHTAARTAAHECYNAGYDGIAAVEALPEALGMMAEATRAHDEWLAGMEGLEFDDPITDAMNDMKELLIKLRTAPGAGEG